MKVSRHALIFGLSYALDIAGKNNLSHSKSTAYLSLMIGRQLGLSDEDLLALYYAALLHDIGVSNEYVLNQHCLLGEQMLKPLPLPQEIPTYVLYHHEYYNGCGLFALKGDNIPLPSQIICFSSSFDDVFGKKRGAFDTNLFKEITEWLEEKKQMHSEKIRTAFETLCEREFFLLNYFNHETRYTLSYTITIGQDVYYGYKDVIKFAECFADIIDRRSPFTSEHSHGIATLAQKAAGHLGYDAQIQNKMYIAGLLHDIGKLHVSAEILHKNGGLNEDERFEINKHTYYTRKILEQIPGLEDIVDWAANHHERVNGSGYPYHIVGTDMSELERVMAICDVYQALTEKRPYRDGLVQSKVWNIIGNMGESGSLDKALIPKLQNIL